MTDNYGRETIGEDKMVEECVRLIVLGNCDHSMVEVMPITIEDMVWVFIFVIIFSLSFPVLGLIWDRITGEHECG